MKKYLPHLIILAIACLPRLLFLPHGFGLDGDAWRVALAAESMRDSGQYQVSRNPGYPFQEIVMAIIGTKSMILANLMTLMMFIGSGIFLSLIASKLDQRKSVYSLALFCYIPVIVINSVNLMDYMWALFFLLGAFYFAHEKRIILTGIFLGVSVGCRMTGVIYGLPIIGMIWFSSDQNKVKNSVLFFLSSFIFAVLVWLPVLLTYGFDFLSHYRSNWSLMKFVFKSSVEVFGVIGSLSVGLLVLFSVYRFKKIKEHFSELDSDQRILVFGLGGVMMLNVLLFVYLPDEGAYLIPAAACFCILLTPFFSEKVLGAGAVVMIFSCLFVGFTKSGPKLEGMVLLDYQRRVQNMKFLESVKARDTEFDENDVILCGEFLPSILFTLGNSEETKSRYEYLFTEEEYNAAKSEGLDIYYIKGRDRANLEVYGVELDSEAQHLTYDPEPVERYE